MAEHNNLYQNIAYYDLIFERDVSREVDFVIAAYRHYAGCEPQATLEVACGPGYHTRAFARCGLRAIGLDLNGAMIALARRKDTVEGVHATWIEADMRHIQLDEPVDVAFCMFDGLDARLSNLLAEQSGSLQVAGWYGDFDLNQPLDNSPASRRMIAILQKKTGENKNV